MECVNVAQVEALRALLAPSGWLDRTRYFARALRSQSRTPRGLLIVGTPTDEPWHLTAHLADESRLAGLPELEPTLVRWAPPPGAPAHLSIGIERLEHAGRAETVLVVGSDPAPAELLERVADARRAGSSIFALDRGDDELDDLAHESLAVRPAVDPVSFDGAQHLVSLAVGEEVGIVVPAPRQVGQSGPLGQSGRLAPSGWFNDARVAGVADQAHGATRLAQARSRLGRLLDTISGPQPDEWSRR
jgi:hypothetical protein